jgi:phage FluMu protein Com
VIDLAAKPKESINLTVDFDKLYEKLCPKCKELYEAEIGRLVLAAKKNKQ